MLFNSYVFIFLFLPVVVTIFFLIRKDSRRAWTVGLLVLASLFYYAWWKPAFLLLLISSICVNAFFGKLFCGGRLSRRAAQGLLVVGVSFNLGLLAYFKYAMFIVGNLNDWFGSGFTVPKIILPIGISFFTFQQIAFLVDARRGLVSNFSFLNYALFVTFFPQLIAGPIVHHAEMMPQFVQRTLPGDRKSDLAVGLIIFCIGLFKKVMVADTCAVYADAGFDTLTAGHPLGFMSAWITVFAFSFQIYYDFSGYSDMAVGLARLFGIQLPVNFHSPYKATGVIEFWRRWHITLSRCLRDYLYFPLGGNRVGRGRNYLNLGIVMLLGGLWHGASWTFVVWGAVHGGLLAVNHAWNQLRISRLALFGSRPAKATFILLTFLAVTLAWVPFRADSLPDAERMLAALFPQDWESTAWPSLNQFLNTQLFHTRSAWNILEWFRPRELWPPVLPPDYLATSKPVGYLLLGVGIATFLLPNTNQLLATFDPVLGLTGGQRRHRASLRILDWKVALVISGAFVLSVLGLSKVSPFLYYQF